MLCCSCFGRRPKPNQTKDQKLKDVSDQSSLPSSARAVAVSETRQHPKNPNVIFTYRELATATNNFRADSLIGRGGFGAVFKGTIESTGQSVAVKMLDTAGVQGEKEFLVEVLMLSLLRNENLVKLIGYCAEGDQRLLVYEYMPMGSVEDHIHHRRAGQKVIDWTTRMEIALGAAKGLQHLHNVAKPHVIFRDLKTANILLDGDYKPKLSDFGLAKFGPSEDMSHVSTRVMGTHGYCAPEYANSGRLTLKSDIYSFGVVLLELITGRKPVMEAYMGPHRFLGNWAMQLYMTNDIRIIVDPKIAIQGRNMESTVRRALEVAFMCLREEANTRPAINEIVGALEYIVDFSKTKQKGKGNRPRGRVNSPGETSRMLLNVVSEEEEEGEDREKAVAEAKTWAETWRVMKRKDNEASSSTSVDKS